MTTPLITCSGVGVTYGSGSAAVVAVHGLTGTVHAGDRIAVTGPSGSGKSTVLHLLAGLERATVGEIGWPGLRADARDPGQIGLVFQTPSLIPSLTVADNVALPLLLRGDAPADAGSAAHDALAVLGLEGLQGNLPQELSGGQAQRVVLARVLAARPRVVLADEPTSQLDRGTADHLADVLLRVSDEIGAALVVATHDPVIGGRLTTTWSVADGRLAVAAHGANR